MCCRVRGFCSKATFPCSGARPPGRVYTPLTAHFASDVIDTVQRGFSESQLWLTLVAEAAIPTFVIGLAAAQRPRLGRLDAHAAAGNAYSYDVVLRGGNTQIAAPKRTP